LGPPRAEESWQNFLPQNAQTASHDDESAGTVATSRWYDWGMQFTAAVIHESPWYVARCLEVDVVSQGETVDKALENLKEALELYFEDEVMPQDSEPPIIATVLISA
jgi:predicted RNase H-like HicB family nuclease